VHEEIKLRNLIPKAADMLPDGGEHEVKLDCEDFVGYIDLLVPVGDNAFDIHDFKYSNAVDRYKESAQLHLYKYYFERTHPGKHIDKLFYLIVPKTQIRQKKSEPTLFEF
ncbi:PD-(D/E)XK nuclease family protein, partial [Pseudomonas aeruginosa]|uniref:PD-(D/E)XK nuclease family protein n=1 Tax=Pseudomonas aeruginosa TaxID=287 RepID=UPI001F4A3086